MPSDPQRLLSRLDSIARALEASGRGLGLLALGSVGEETERLDAWSDLDFFALVAPGTKAGFLADLSWLATEVPLVYAFRNTVDGFKVLYEDGVFAEWAVFEPAELAGIPFAPGRWVWRAEGVPEAWRLPVRRDPPGGPPSADYRVGEALTCLLVGLGRFRRGERLAAHRLIQQHAFDHVLALLPTVEASGPALADPFAPERRFEQRFPAGTAELARFLPGYERSPEAALALLAWLEAHFPVNEALAGRIRALAS
jgi:hypothetical protein